MITLLIVDDHEVFRRSLVDYLKTIPEFKVVGQCSEGLDVLPFLSQNKVSVILMDVKMKNQQGIDTTLLVKAYYPNVKIIGMSFYDDWGTIYRFHQSGGHEFVSKFELDDKQLVKKIKTINRLNDVVKIGGDGSKKNLLKGF